MNHFWYCVFGDHNGFSGCGDLLWVSDYYDLTTGFISLFGMASVMVWMAVDEWRSGDRLSVYAGAVYVALMLFVGLLAALGFGVT